MGAAVAIGAAVVGGEVVTGMTESVAALHDSSKLSLLGCPEVVLVSSEHVSSVELKSQVLNI